MTTVGLLSVNFSSCKEDPPEPKIPNPLVGVWEDVNYTSGVYNEVKYRYGTRVIFTDTHVTAFIYDEDYNDDDIVLVTDTIIKWFDNERYLLKGDTLEMPLEGWPAWYYGPPFRTKIEFIANDTLFIEKFNYGWIGVPFPQNLDTMRLYRSK